MQLGAVLVFQAGPLQLRHGGIDVERIRAYTQKRLAELPRARERRVRLAFGALEVFREDPGFELDYHVRHVSLPRPGDERALKRLAARVFSQALDPEKPPWELWLAEGLEGGRFALLARCDSALLEAHAAAGLLGAGEALVRRAISFAQPAELAALVASGAGFALDFARDSLTPAAARPGRASEGAHQRVEWLALAAADVAAIRARLGGTERDVVLAALAGGVRRVSERRGAPESLERLQVATPSCVGGRIEVSRFRLPSEIADPRARFVAVRAACERMGSGARAASVSPLHELAGLAAAVVGGRRADLAAFELATPPAPEQLLGARLEAFVPVAPRLPGHALAVTVTHLGERAFVGLTSDAARIPDLAALTDGVAAAFDELRRLSSGPENTTAKRGARPRRRRGAHKPMPLEAR